MKPITYWIQNGTIDELVQDYGPHLEQLIPGDRRDLIVLLAHPRLWNGIDCSREIDRIFERLQGLNRRDKDLLIEAIAATLTHKKGPDTEGLA